MCIYSCMKMTLISFHLKNKTKALVETQLMDVNRVIILWVTLYFIYITSICPPTSQHLLLYIYIYIYAGCLCEVCMCVVCVAFIYIYITDIAFLEVWYNTWHRRGNYIFRRAQRWKNIVSREKFNSQGDVKCYIAMISKAISVILK